MTYLNLLLIQFIIVFIIDLSGVIYYFKKLYCRILFGKYYPKNLPYTIEIKPFTCSLCLVTHFTWIYLLIVNDFTLINLSYGLLLAYLTPFTKNFILLITNILEYLIIKIQNLLK